MKIDPEVSRNKFKREVEKLEGQTQTLLKRGIFVYEVSFPTVKVIFTPRNCLTLSLPVEFPAEGPFPPGFTIPEGAKLPPGAKVQALQTNKIPSLAARPFGARISLEDFDQLPPSVVFCDPFSWEEMPYQVLHRGNHIGDNGNAFCVLLGDHPLNKKPFLCMRGIREYHLHPQHTGDDWMQYRVHCGLFSTVETIWKTCVLNANPNLIFQPPNIQVSWAPLGAF